jgi:hypothetical protein
MCNECTWTVVVQSTANPNNDVGVMLEIENGNGPILDVSPAGTQWDAAITFGYRGTVVGGTPTAGVPHILNFCYDAATPGSGTGTIKLYVDGTLAATSTYTGLLITSNSIPEMFSYNGGGNFGFAGYMAMCAMQAGYTASGAQLIAQNRWVGNKYGITVP